MPISFITVRHRYGLMSLIPAFFFTVFVSACNKPAFIVREVQKDSISAPSVDTIDKVPQDAIKPLTALELLNEHYGKDSLQVMDIYLPAGRDPEVTHIMVFIHGEDGWEVISRIIRRILKDCRSCRQDVYIYREVYEVMVLIASPASLV